MFEGTSTVTIFTRIRAGVDQQQTLVTIDWTGYTPELAMADLMAGTSPRVAIQARLREDGIPKTLTVRATEFHAKRPRVERPMTQEELAAAALKDPAVMALIRAQVARDAGNAG